MKLIPMSIVFAALLNASYLTAIPGVSGLCPKGNTQLTISNVNFWTTDTGPEGMVHTIGTVENPTGQYYKARIKVVYLDTAGKPINVEGWLSELKGELDGSMDKHTQGDVTSVETVLIAPNSKSYFHQYRSVSKIAGKVVRVKVDFEKIENAQAKFKMEISNLTTTHEVETKTIWDGTQKTYDNGWRIKGTLTNHDRVSAETPKIAILFYGADGKIWGDKVIDCTMQGFNTIILSQYGSLKSKESLNFDILCDHPQIDLNGKTVKISKVEVIGYKDIPYSGE